MEFHKAMRTHFGYQGSTMIIDEVFRSLDTDGSGAIGYDELYEFVRGRRHSLDERTKREQNMRLCPPPPMTLDNLEWDVESIRILMQQMAVRANMSPAELFRAWDRDGDKKLTKKEFTDTMYHWFFHQELPDLWDNEVLPVAKRAFDDISNFTKSANAISTKDPFVDYKRLTAWMDAKPWAAEDEIARL